MCEALSSVRIKHMQVVWIGLQLDRLAGLKIVPFPEYSRYVLPLKSQENHRLPTGPLKL